MKQQRKLFAILTLVAFMMTLLPMAAFAATTTTALTTPSVNTGTNRALGTVRVMETAETVGSIAPGTEITVTLPSGVTYSSVIAAGALTLPGNDFVNIPTSVGATSNTITGATILPGATNKTFTVRVDAIDGTKDRAILEFTFNVPSTSTVDITTSGAIEIDVFSTSAGVTSGKVINGYVVTGATTATAVTTTSCSEGVGQTIGHIRIVENAAQALAIATDSISLVLPEGYTWATAPTISVGGGFAPGAVTVGTTDTDANGFSRLRLNVVGLSSGQPGVINLTGGTVDIAHNAQLGDAVVKVGGSNTGMTASNIVPVKKVEFGVTVSEKTAPVRYAGANAAEMGTIVVTEGAAGSILQGRNIRMTLPENARWVAGSLPQAEVLKGGLVLSSPTIVAGTSDRTVQWSVTTASGSAAEIEFKRGEFAVRANASVGDLVVLIDGNATVSGQAKIAELQKPITAVAATADVIIGKQAQEAGNIIITEAAAATIKARHGSSATQSVIEVRTPGGVTWAADPVVKVIDGDLKLDLNNVTRDGSLVTIPVDNASNTASTIEISNVKYTVDRTRAEGDVVVGIRGTALNRMAAFNIAPALATDNAATVVAAQVVTPAPGDKTAVGEVKFTLGSMFYTVGDSENLVLDVAPYAKNGRTYLPVRFAATAVGVDHENVVWNSSDRTVTIFNDARIIQLTVGSNIMTINGTAITMDAAPEIVDGRTMLPVRFVAQALSKTIDYNDATKEITIN